MFAIGLVLLLVGAFACNVYGHPIRGFYNRADYVAGSMILIGAILMLGSGAIVLWRAMP